MKTGRRLLLILKRVARAFKFGAATVLQQNTTYTNNLGADGYSWAQSYQPTIDQYGIIVTIVQIHGQGLAWIVSNDDGATWTDITVSPGDGLYPVPVTRMSMAYDSISDKFHVLYLGSTSDDGMIYRRYSPIRNPDNTITGFTKDANTNLQLDFTNQNSPSYMHPTLLFCSDIGAKGAIVAFWGAKVGSNVEVRASMRELTNTSADGVAGNWSGLGVAGNNAINNTPAVAYSTLMSSNTGIGGHSSILRKARNSNINDLYIFYEDRVGGIDKWRYRRAIWNGTNWDTLSAAVNIGNLLESGEDNGYGLKSEIGSKIAESDQDFLYFGYSVWKNDTVGDTWQFVEIDTLTDTVSTPVVVYNSVAANNGSTIFITGDIFFDLVSKRLVVTYTDLPAKHAYIIGYKRTTAVTAPKLIFNTAPVDIPVIVDRKINNKFVVLFRDFNSAAANNPPTYTPPYTGYWVTVA